MASSSSMKPSSRYTSFDSRSSNSNPSSSSELKSSNKHSNPLKRFISSGGSGGGGGSGVTVRRNSPHGVLKPNSSDLVKLNVVKKEQNLSTMVKKFMEKKSFSSTSSSNVNRKADAGTNGLVAAADLLTGELKKRVKKASSFTALQRKLFNKGSLDSSGGGKSEVKVLTEVKSNTRTLAMVLRSERELLSQNKELEAEMQEIRLLLEERNIEVEKLKDLCLMQREEIKRLKSAILFPDVTNSQLQDLFEKQGSELRQAKQVIPTLQRQVTSLTGELQCLAGDLAEVKADKFSSHMGFEGHIRSPMTPAYDQEVGNSLEFSSGDYTTRSSDEMLMKDLNPLLTPYARTRSKEYQTMLNDESPPNERLSNNNDQIHRAINFDTNNRKLSRSSDYWHKDSNPGRLTIRAASRRSDANAHLARRPSTISSLFQK